MREEAALCGHILLTEAASTSPQTAAAGCMYLTVCLLGLHDKDRSVTYHCRVCVINVFIHLEDSMNYSLSLHQ